MLQFKIINPEAAIPKKAGKDEVGYDITALSCDKIINNKTYMYDTGLQVKPPDGYYLEIVPRSSIIKTGYILSNSVGIIDPTYRGNIKIVLTKVDDSAPQLRLPFTKCQLILRKLHDAEIIDIGNAEWDETNRGTGGFGSTDA